MHVLSPAAAQKRALTVLVCAQILSGAGLAAGITVGAILAEDILGTTALAGVPTALFAAGSALAAVLIGRLSQRSGRRPGLASGYLVGALGALGTVAAAAAGNAPALFAALFVYGAGSATNLQARYAGADLAEPHRRASAISTVLVATTLGAVAGPNLVEPTGAVAEALGLPRLTGPFLLAAFAYAAAALVLAVWLRPDPLVLARELASEAAAGVPDGSAADVVTGSSSSTVSPAPAAAHDRSGVRLGAAVMVTTQIIMAAVMTMTPVHMKHHGHGLGATGLVIGLHIAAMYLPAPLSGRLVDRLGSRAVARLAALTLVAAALTAAFAPPTSLPLVALALVLLGLGWSLGLVSGTTALTNAVPLERRAQVQGSVDVLVAIGGAGAGMASGLVMSTWSFGTLGVLCAVLAIALTVLLTLRTTPRA